MQLLQLIDPVCRGIWRQDEDLLGMGREDSLAELAMESGTPETPPRRVRPPPHA